MKKIKEMITKFVKGIAKRILAEEIKGYEAHMEQYSAQKFYNMEKELREAQKEAKRELSRKDREIEMLKMTIEYIKETNNIA